MSSLAPIETADHCIANAAYSDQSFNVECDIEGQCTRNSDSIGTGVSRNSRPISFYYQKFRGLKSKIDKFYLAVTSPEFDVIILTETWLDERIKSLQLFGNEYVIYRVNRNPLTIIMHRSAGGVLIAVSIKFDSSLCTEGIACSLEQIFVRIRLKRHQLFVRSFYLPYERRHEPAFMSEHVASIERILNISSINEVSSLP